MPDEFARLVEAANDAGPDGGWGVDLAATDIVRGQCVVERNFGTMVKDEDLRARNALGKSDGAVVVGQGER